MWRASLAPLFLVGAVSGSTPAPLPAVTLADGPVVNGINMTDPGWGDDQPLVSKGLLDVTKPPFNADPTGVQDASDAFQAAVESARQAYLTVFIPSGSFKITRTLAVVQPEKMFVTTVGEPNCNNMHEVFGAPTFEAQHCGRTAPVVLQGTKTQGASRPELFVPAGLGFSGPVVQLHNPINENINMNQEIHGVDIRIEEGNPDAVGIYARGAQGVTVQDVVIHAGSASIGLEGGAGSGGSHIDVTVIGGQVGLKVGSAQPAPTLTGVRLINQSVSALLYQNPGRQTLSITGLEIQVSSSSSGPAIDASAPLSLVDARILGSASGSTRSAIAASKKCSLFLQNVWIQNFAVAVTLANGTEVPAASSQHPWTHIKLLAAGSSTPQIPNVKSSAFLDGKELPGLLQSTGSSSVPQDVVSQHLWGPEAPSWETEGACFAKDFGARGDLETDDTEALQSMLDDPHCRVSVLEKGYFAVTRPLQLAPNASLVGVGLIYSNLVPHESAGSVSAVAWPLLRTSEGRHETANIVALSILVWRHTNASYAFQWRAGGGIWRRAHINRVDLSPGKYEQAFYNRPLSLLEGHGGGRFFSFYQENWDFQGPSYRHLLVSGTDSPWFCYHCNLEHSKGEANLEIRGAQAPVRLYGFKGEGNYVQVWIADSADVEVSGYGGNASPFPANCHYPPNYSDYPPSIFRIERTPRFLIANIVVQTKSTGETRCGIYDTGFAGTFYSPATFSVLHEATPSGKNVTVEPMQWPFFYGRGLESAAQLEGSTFFV